MLTPLPANYRCSGCVPAVKPVTQTAQRATQRYRWCVKCQGTQAFFPVKTVRPGERVPR